MFTVPESPATVQFDTALLDAVARAKAVYPTERVRIEKGLQLVLADAIRLLPDGTALVCSQTQPGLAYHVNGHCDCADQRAPEGRCKHRWSKAFYKRASLATATVQPVASRSHRRAYGAHRQMTPAQRARNVAESITMRIDEGRPWSWDDYGLADNPTQQALVCAALAIIAGR